MDRHNYLATIGAVSSAAIAGCSSDESNSGNNNGDDNENSNGGSEFSESDTLPTVSDISDIDSLPFEIEIIAELEGSGNAVTDEFTVDSELIMLAFELNGNVEPLDTFYAATDQIDGDGGESLVINELLPSETNAENISGASLASVSPGNWVLDIESEGDWEITVAQLGVPTNVIRTPPVSVSGSGTTVAGPVELSNGGSVYANHKPEQTSDIGIFSVSMYEDDNTSLFQSDIVFAAEDHGFEGEARTDLDGTVWVYVRTSGEWEIEIE